VWRENWLKDPPATVKADCFKKVLNPNPKKGKIRVVSSFLGRFLFLKIK
jgi:hypothetical protein